MPKVRLNSSILKNAIFFLQRNHFLKKIASLPKKIPPPATAYIEFFFISRRSAVIVFRQNFTRKRSRSHLRRRAHTLSGGASSLFHGGGRSATRFEGLHLRPPCPALPSLAARPDPTQSGKNALASPCGSPGGTRQKHDKNIFISLITFD